MMEKEQYQFVTFFSQLKSLYRAIYKILYTNMILFVLCVWEYLSAFVSVFCHFLGKVCNFVYAEFLFWVSA